MKIVSMQRDMPEMAECRPSDYAYGLCIHLGHEELEKLGITTMPAIGDTVQIAGKALVIALRQDGEIRNMELQITDLGVGSGKKTPASKMYPSANED